MYLGGPLEAAVPTLVQDLPDQTLLLLLSSEKPNVNLTQTSECLSVQIVLFCLLVCDSEGNRDGLARKNAVGCFSGINTCLWALIAAEILFERDSWVDSSKRSESARWR